jgi:hypothetical protein
MHTYRIIAQKCSVLLDFLSGLSNKTMTNTIPDLTLKYCGVQKVSQSNLISLKLNRKKQHAQNKGQNMIPEQEHGQEDYQEINEDLRAARNNTAAHRGNSQNYQQGNKKVQFNY